MSKPDNGSTGFWIWASVVVGIALLGQLFGNNSATTNTKSGEQIFVEDKFKQEGYSNSESQKAAEAVMRFHEAQKNRK